ncbi:MAG: hypothetical protein ACHRXM_33160 [Isosphaerales bacterium]
METAPNTQDILTYEQRLRLDRSWSMDEGDRHFQHDSLVFRTLRKIARRLEDLGVPYAVAGGMALEAHGFRRLTVDVDILVNRDGLKTIHEKLAGPGYIQPFSGSKHLRDTEHGVRIEFLVAGEFPGDGKPKAVAFPEPEAVGVGINGVRYLSLPSLVELKLASGMTNLGRMKDLADVQELIKAIGLSAEFAVELNPYVRDKFLELWQGIRDSPVGPIEPWPE